ncbi:hypothetical protein DNI29_21450 [Hymenobacter sediminis]|uniref:hypothetical protein n=1 Tax=Hymenobacter sediminis TaxID=2218621 RepID=UPI000DA68591|nr:hypothetical protein [Hymenobacter sediminis]RPD44696.1 hypothetical protein DNI29_21450 [Hymenobacter sediminis]
MRKEVLELSQLGPLPNEDQDIADGVLEHYEELLHRIQPPITRDEAEQLIKLFPATACFGLEWTLLHIIESTPDWPILSIIELCPSVEWKQQILDRISNT